MLNKFDIWVSRFIPKRKKRYGIYCIIGIPALALIIWGILNLFGVVGIHWKFVQDNKLDIIISLSISIIGLIFSILIIDSIKGFFANNIDEFLNLLNSFLADINAEDEIVIITPTLCIGGIQYNGLFKKYSEGLTKLIKNNKNVKVYSNSITTELIKKFNKLEDYDKKKGLITKSTNHLIKFHKELWKERANRKEQKKTDPFVEYIQEFITFYKDLPEIKINNLNTLQNELKTVTFLKISSKSKNNNGVFGIFDDKYELTGNTIKNDSVIAINKLLMNNK